MLSVYAIVEETIPILTDKSARRSQGILPFRVHWQSPYLPI